MKVRIASLLESLEAEGVGFLRYPLQVVVDLEDERNPAVPMEGTFYFLREGKKFLISGTFQGSVQLECRRCLEVFPSLLEVHIEEEGLLEATLPPSEEEIWTEDGTWLLPLEGWLDLKELVRQHTLLALPMSPLCRPECPGLEREASPEAQGDPRWAILGEYRRRLEEGSSA